MHGGTRQFVPADRVRQSWAKVLRMLPASYPDAPPLPMQMAAADEVRFLRATPTVISVPDYSKGFAHTDLVTC